MKITVFQSDKGDCLLLEGRAGGLVLADGGMGDTYTRHVSPYLDKLRKKKRKLDAVYVSHIDEDHISGILQMMNDAVDWRIYDYQKTVAKNSSAKKPASLRPPEVDRIWHNAFHEQVNDNTGDIEDTLAATVAILAGSEAQKYIRMAVFHQEVATSIRQAINLSRRIDEKQLNIQLNPEAGGKLMVLRNLSNGKKPSPIKLGSMDWSLIGPMPADLSELRKEWNAWLKENQKAIENIQDNSKKTEKRLGNSLTSEANQIVGIAASQAETLAIDLLNQLGQKAPKVLGVRSKVTVPNLASLMFYVEEGVENGVVNTVLMTGDGHWEDILHGLEASKKIKKDEAIHVNVLKVQHHGSEHNLNRDFCKRVTADHYIFCGNGAHENPDVEVVQAILDSRLVVGHQGTHPNVNHPFKLWFNSSSANPETEPQNREHMRQIEDLVAKATAANKHRLSSFFLKRSSFEINV